MKKIACLLLALCLLLPLCAHAEEQGLKDVWSDVFRFGCAVPQHAFRDEAKTALLLQHFNTLTPENEMKPDSLLDLTASRALAKDGDETHPAVHFDAALPLLNFARDNGMTVHGHVLVWHSQTPDAFFRVGYQPDGELCDRETMLARMENYIAAVFAYLDENYPGLVTSFDVVNEAISDSTGQVRLGKSADEKNGSRWVDTVGPDFVEYAFRYARKYAPEGMTLYYNDYSIPNTKKLLGVVQLVKPLKEEGTIDAVGLQCHYNLSWPSARDIDTALNTFTSMGLKISATEIDIDVESPTDEQWAAQAKRYQEVIETFLPYAEHMERVTVWGLADNMSWKADKYPLLFDGKLQPKEALKTLMNRQP